MEILGLDSKTSMRFSLAGVLRGICRLQSSEDPGSAALRWQGPKERMLGGCQCRFDLWEPDQGFVWPELIPEGAESSNLEGVGTRIYASLLSPMWTGGNAQVLPQCIRPSTLK